MTFLSPLYLAGAAAAAIPLILHLLKKNPELHVKFAPVHLLRDAPVENTDRRHLRQLLLLALRISALLLLALAFARPVMRARAALAQSGTTIVALDTSMSLSAPGVFTRAQQLARDAVRAAPSGDRVGVMTFADGAQEAAAPSADRGLALAAIDGATAGSGATRYRAVFDRAVDVASASGGGPLHLVVVTDMQESGWDAGDRASMPDTARIDVVDVGSVPANLAVTGVRLAGDRLVATVLNAGGEPRDIRVSATSESSTPRTASRAAAQNQAVATVAANESAEVTVPAPQGEAARVSIDDPHGIPGDNSRFIVLNDASRPTIAVITATGDLAREALYLKQALSVGGESRKAAVEGAGVAQLASWDAAQMRRFSAVVLLWTRGIERRGRERLAEFVKQGGALLVTAGPGMDPDVIADIISGVKLAPGDETGDPRSMTVEDVRHPMFQTFGGSVSGLGLVRFTRAAEINAAECHPVARFTTGRAALVDCSPGEGRALVFASDLDNKWNDFPLHPSFVPFLHEALRYLTGSRQASSEYLVADAPPGVPRQPGIARIPTANGGTRLAAINVDPRESDPRRLSSEEFQAAVSRSREPAGATAAAAIRGDEDRQHIWQYLLWGMAFVLVAESLVARRAI